MILTITRVADFDQFLRTFSTTGLTKRAEHGCRGAWVFRDRDDHSRVWALFDWDAEDYEGFLSDPEVPAIAADLGVNEPPVTVESVAQFDS